MTKKIAMAADEAVKRVIDKVKSLPEKSVVLVAGIGNTCGVAQ